MTYSETPQQRLDRSWSMIEILCNDLLISSLKETNVFHQYQMLLNEFRHDRIVGDVTLLGMKRAPGSKDRHHDYEGGLIQHLLEMWDLWSMWKSHFSNRGVPLHPVFSDANVWRAILHHDLNKVWRYRLVTLEPFAVEYHERDLATKTLGSMNKSLWMLQRHGIVLDLPLANAMVCSEGGYGTRPYIEMTSFAKLIYLLDEGSANVMFLLGANRFWDPKAGGLNDTP